MIESVVSIQRLSDYLGASELQSDARKFIEMLHVENGQEVRRPLLSDFGYIYLFLSIPRFYPSKMPTFLGRKQQRNPH